MEHTEQQAQKHAQCSRRQGTSLATWHYFRQKGWAIQSATFDANLKYRQVNGEDYPTIADLDYSEEVAQRVLSAADDYRRKKLKSKDKKKAKARSKGKMDGRIPKLKKDSASYKRVIEALPHIREYVTLFHNIRTKVSENSKSKGVQEIPK